jgi:carboxymethylenebutenolidase
MSKTLLTIAAAIGLAACQRSEPTPPPTAAPAPRVAAAREVPTPSPDRPATVALLEQTVAYGEGKGMNLVGFLAMPADAVEPLPGLLVIHEWWGLNDDVKAMARRLATAGYIALAVDLFGGAVAKTPDQARTLMAGVIEDPEAARANLRQGYQYLEKYAFAPRVGSIGWSLGGNWALQMAILYPDDLNATVIYYGDLVLDPKELARIKAPVLGLFAQLDESIPVRDVLAFREGLSQLGKESEVLIYPRAKHGFANPGDSNYDEKSAGDAWQTTLTFLARNLAAPGAAK